MSSRTSNVLALLVLLVAVFLRLWNLTTLPPGFHQDEINDIRIAETARQGRIEVFYDLGGEGREGLYDIALTIVSGAVGGGLLGYRMLPFWIGLFTLGLVYALVKKLYNPLAGLAAMALLAVGMWPVMLSRTVSRENILPLLLTVVLLSLASAFSIPRRRTRRLPTSPFTVLGLLLGAGFYIHEVHFFIALMAMIFILVMMATQRMTRRRLGYIGFALVMTIVIGMPYVISSIRLPELAGPGRLFAGLAITDPGPVRAFIDGLEGFFLVGDASATRNLPERPLIELFSGLFVILGLVVALRYIRQPRFSLPLIAALVLLPVALAQQDSPNFRAMTVLLPLAALFFGAGVSAIYYSLSHRARPVMLAGLLVLFAFNLYWVGRDLFVLWPGLPEVQAAYQGRLAQISNYLDQTARDVPAIVCVPDLRADRTGDLDTFEILALMMHRQNVMIRYADCGTGLIFASGGGSEQVIFTQADTLFNLHRYVRDWLGLGEVLERPGLPPQSVVTLDVEQPLADTIGRFTTTVPVYFAPESPGGMQPVQPPVRLGGNITFLGYEPISEETYRPGDYVTVISYWRVDGTMPQDLRLFAHVLLDPATIAAQNDILSVLPASLEPRDVFLQITFVRLPQVLPPGTYRISMGAYEDNTDTRLSVFDGDLARGQRLFLDEIVVEPHGG